jgi:tRNA threonylcarbamoyl adenosine modification protein (Sua5/YciO/YrdC/YwlC family)
LNKALVVAMPIIAATDVAIACAAGVLTRGEIVAFPTETVYGLGANALDADAVAKVFAAKARPRFNPLIVHVLGKDEAEAYATVSDTARKLMQAFWPGPLSLVLPRREDCGIADLVSAGLDTVALRAPLLLLSEIEDGIGEIQQSVSVVRAGERLQACGKDVELSHRVARALG